MSIEVAFRKVSTRSWGQSIALSEEFTLTHGRTVLPAGPQGGLRKPGEAHGLEGVKSVCLALMQSERYGTPLGQSLRVMAQETATCA